MTQVDGAFGGWDGWVLYTSEDGHKYHWNHLTHESRWAVGEAAEDHLAEECFQEYIRQRASMVDLNDHHAKTLGAVEAGEEKDDDDAVVCAGLDDFAGIVVAPCGDGPPTTSATAWDGAGMGGIAARVSGALRRALSMVECPRRDTGGISSTKEWDPELGQNQHNKCHKSQRRRTSRGSCNTAVSGTTSSSSGRDSSSRSRRSSSDSSGSSSGSSGGSSDCADSGRSSTKSRGGASKMRELHKKDNMRLFVPNQRKARNGSKRLPTFKKGLRASSRRSQIRKTFHLQGHSNLIKGKVGVGQPEAASNDKIVGTTAVKGMASLGRQAVASVVSIAVRAVVGSWMGMTTATLKAVRNWQVDNNLEDAVLPIVMTGTSSCNGSHSDPIGKYTNDKNSKRHRAPFRAFLPKNIGPPQSFFSSSPLRGEPGKMVQEEQEIDRAKAALEGFREEDHEVGCWVGGDGGTEEQKGGLPSSPQSWGKIVL